MKLLETSSSSSLRQALHSKPCDALFVPSGAVPWGLRVPAIPWIHDLTILDHPEWFPESWLRRQYTTRMVLRGIKKAPVVFAVSEYTKRSIIECAGVDERRVVVTGEGGDEALQRITNDELRIARSEATDICYKKLGLKSPFVLALGTVEPRKNLAMLIRAWSASLAQAQPGQKVDLVVAGRWGWKCEDVKREIASLPAEVSRRLRRIENISDDDKRWLLLASSAVAVPSLDEGFGLVALEGMQAGTQVIASDRGALPEVVGQAETKLDPLDEGAWARALSSVGLQERPKIFNSVGLAAAVNALKGQSSPAKPINVVSSVALKVSHDFRSTILGKFNWERTTQIILDGLKRCA